jgi:glycerate kinase
MNRNLVRILVCANAFKGSLTSVEACEAISMGFERVNQLNQTASSGNGARFQIVCIPLADGGDGTLETLVAATSGEIMHARVHGPLGDMIDSAWGRLGGEQSGTAVIEMARASGLALLSTDRYDPLHSSTIGTGELMLAAIEAGSTKLLVGIGGSATTDGGAGMASALGARLLDASGAVIPDGGIGLEQLAKIDMSRWKLPPEIEVIVACDVDNPLTGMRGAATVYGPQKGADPETVSRLDKALVHYAKVLASTFGTDVSSVPGAGAAGGLGAGLLAFSGARLVPGAEMVLDAVQFSKFINTCSLIVTGEGLLDGQTASGKVIGAVASRAQFAGTPCVALVGGIRDCGDGILRPHGLTTAFCIEDGPMELSAAMQNGSRLLTDSAERLARLVSALVPLP